MDTLMTSHGIREKTVLDFKLTDWDEREVTAGVGATIAFSDSSERAFISSDWDRSDTPKDPPSPKVEQEPEPPSGAKTEWEWATADTPPRLSPCPSLERAPEADNDGESSSPQSWASCLSSFVEPHYVILKKHEDLTKFSPDGIVALRHAVGHTIGYVDGGYHLLMKAVPKSRTGWAQCAGQVNKWNDRKPVKGGMFIQLEEQSGCILREEEKEDFPVSVHARPPKASDMASRGYGAERNFYFKWREAQKKERVQYILAQCGRQPPMEAKVSSIVQKENWVFNEPRFCDVIQAWSPPISVPVESDESIIASITEQRWKGVDMEDFGGVKGKVDTKFHLHASGFQLPLHMPPSTSRLPASFFQSQVPHPTSTLPASHPKSKVPQFNQISSLVPKPKRESGAAPLPNPRFHTSFSTLPECWAATWPPKPAGPLQGAGHVRAQLLACGGPPVWAELRRSPVFKVKLQYQRRPPGGLKLGSQVAHTPTYHRHQVPYSCPPHGPSCAHSKVEKAGGLFSSFLEQSAPGRWNPASPTHSRLDVKGQAVTTQACGSTSAGEAQVTIQL
ncbi:hypothetical protein ABVT39_021159 [Epinephelus coioides]